MKQRQQSAPVASPVDVERIRQAAAEICRVWHELERPSFERSYASLEYDGSHYAKTPFEKQVYICLDVGSGRGRSGRGIIDKRTGDVWGISAYGVPNRIPRHYYGNVFASTPAEIAAKLPRQH